LSKTQYQYTLTDVDQEELNTWASRLLKVLQTLPELSDVAPDQATTGRQLNLEINRDTAARLGIDPAAVDNTLYDAFGQRHVAQIFTTLNFYWVVMEVNPPVSAGSLSPESNLCGLFDWCTGAAEPIRHDCPFRRAAGGQSPGPIPVRHVKFQSETLPS
jgi:AcrB/AcrD/AcrF family